MDKNLLPIYEALQSFAEAVEQGWTSDSTLQALYGWAYPPLNRIDLANMSRSLASLLNQGTVDTGNLNLIDQLFQLPEKINAGRSIIPQLYNGNGTAAVTSYFILLNYVRVVLEPVFGWQLVNDSKAMPAQLAKRVRTLQAEIENIIPDKLDLEIQIKLIQDATAAAESLPTDLKALKDARNKVETMSTHAAELYGQIGLHTKDAAHAKSALEEDKLKADKIVEQCLESYRISTSTGLAGAFDDRAHRLSFSIYTWVVGLLASLIICGWIGLIRFESLTKVLDVAKPSWSVVWLHILLSIVSISAPIWFAWLSTKQIGQRFRLSEDYAYKASVAKAYEGYRREAVRLDPEFEARLFSSALTRLEEAPLRLVESDTHGSPFHELINSQIFLMAIEKMPELADKVIHISRGAWKHRKLIKDESIEDSSLKE